MKSYDGFFLMESLIKNILLTDNVNFPHFFNTPKNQSFIGSYPDQHFYGCDFMSIEENSKFIEWDDNQIS